MRPSLTPKQKEVYDFYKEFWKVEQRCPSLREVCEGRINNKQILEQRAARSTAYAIVNHLVSKNYFDVTYHIDRPSYYPRELEQ